MSNANKPGLTYAQAGVDIDAGTRMVELIKPHVRSTRRPGRSAGRSSCTASPTPTRRSSAAAP